MEITIVNTSRRQSASISAFGSGTMLPQRVDNFQITAALVVHCAGHAHGREERDAPFALPVKAPEQDHRLLCTVSTRLSGTAMPAFAASARATASHATVLISSSRRARKAAPAVRPEAEYAWRLSQAYDLKSVPTGIKPRILTTAINEDDNTASLALAMGGGEVFRSGRRQSPHNRKKRLATPSRSGATKPRGMASARRRSTAWRRLLSMTI